MRDRNITLYSVIRFLAGGVVFIAILFLVLRFVLRLFGANADATFVEWIYETSAVILTPFAGIFPNSRLEGNLVIEFNTLFAILIYLVIYLLIVELLNFFKRLATEAE